MTITPPEESLLESNGKSEEYEKYIFDLKLVLTKDIVACDIKWSLFVAAAQSYRQHSRLNPCPPKYVNKEKSEYDIDRIIAVISKVPSFPRLLRKINDRETLDDEVVEIVHWVICSSIYPTLKSVARHEFDATLKKVEYITPVSQPTHIFEVLSPQNSSSEEKFRQHAINRRTLFAFHGSQMDSFYSILNFGLQQHLCKTALFGDGIYLSSEPSISMSFSTIGAGWKKSLCGHNLSCIAMCELVDHPQHLQCHVKVAEQSNGRKNNQQVPDKYFVATNNDIVRLRYLLIFAMAPEKSVRIHQNPILNWIYNNKSVATMCFYAFALLAIGLTNSSTGQYLRQLFWQKAVDFLKNVKQGRS